MLGRFGSLTLKHIQKTCNLQLTSRFSTQKAEYIPLRSLNQSKNLLYISGQPRYIPFMIRVLAFTPCAAFILEGLINDWSWMTGIGSFIFLTYGIRTVAILHFYNSRQVSELSVNKNLTKFYFTVGDNYFSELWEIAVLAAHKSSLTARFREVLEKQELKGIKIPKQLKNQLLKMTDKDLQQNLGIYYKGSIGRILQIESQFIEKMEMVSKKYMQNVIDLHVKLYIRVKSKQNNVLQIYQNEKQEKEYLMITTKIKHENIPIVLFVPIALNHQKKYEEYLKAFGQGKKITQI